MFIHLKNNQEYLYPTVEKTYQQFEHNKNFLLIGSAIEARGVKGGIVLDIEEAIRGPLAYAVPKGSGNVCMPLSVSFALKIKLNIPENSWFVLRPD